MEASEEEVLLRAAAQGAHMDEATAQRLLTKMEQSEQRHFDNRDRIGRLENLVTTLFEQRVDLKGSISQIEARLGGIERQVNDARAGWKTLVSVGSAVGAVAALAADFLIGRHP